jgi:hypothetical protein
MYAFIPSCPCGCRSATPGRMVAGCRGPDGPPFSSLQLRGLATEVYQAHGWHLPGSRQILGASPSVGMAFWRR